jgi:hypothetical protein
MKDPDRLLDDPAVPAEAKELLGSLAAPTALGGVDRSAIGSRVAASLAAPAALKVASLKVAGTWAAVIAGGTAAVTFAVVTPSAPPAAPPVARAVATVAPTPPKTIQPAREPAATMQAEPAQPKAPAAAKSAPKRDTLALEESLLEQARRSIGTPVQALSLLHEHERRFPNGALTAERLYLTAQAHARAGNQTAARHYAKLLVERFPKSTYVPRVKPLLGSP